MTKTSNPKKAKNEARRKRKRDLGPSKTAKLRAADKKESKRDDKKEEDGNPPAILGYAPVRRIMRDMLTLRRKERLETDLAVFGSENTKDMSENKIKNLERASRLPMLVTHDAVEYVRDEMEQYISRLFQSAYRVAIAGRPPPGERKSTKPPKPADPNKPASKKKSKGPHEVSVLGRHVKVAAALMQSSTDA